MQHKNSLNKILNNHRTFGNLKENRLLNYSDNKNDLDEILNDPNRTVVGYF